jgi:hypothetical protein
VCIFYNDKWVARDQQVTLDSTTTAKIQSARRKIRVRREDSVFVYWILEAHEGVVAYSTLEHKPGDSHRDLMIFVPPGQEAAAERALRSLGELIYDLDPGH